jgi:hypothetical protein
MTTWRFDRNPCLGLGFGVTYESKPFGSVTNISIVLLIMALHFTRYSDLSVDLHGR